ncbi:hypothetical protein LTR56_026255 [Elasticomyces elasticus]|nr:hypothetical protein LTR56_026255 [Elasticomyces elasticus]KAK3619047.1 hypothetical protein LTR22_026124 [Elasticomyces elasticus]KAK5726342.1 hypothetical protein LTS12_027450 [Elasticomyces elasticus]
MAAFTDRSDFPAPRRHMTTQDEKGVSKFIPGQIVPTEANWQQFSPEIFSTLLWGTTTSPALMTNDVDLKAYSSISLFEIVAKNGTNMRFFDFAPGFKSEMHRTDSIDYSIVILGTIENQVDGEEVRVGKPGDVFIQRGTNHLWRNRSETEWTRMCFFVVAAVPLVIGGKELETIKTVNSSLGDK